MVCLVACAVAAMELPMSSSVLATALSADSQTDSQTDSQSDSQSDSVPTPEPANSRRALLIACITIALERFAFYSLVSLFVLFLTEHRGQSEAQANTWYGVMMGATFFTPLIGGAVADRFGRWLCIAGGVFLLASSYGLPDRRIPTPIHRPPFNRNGTLQRQYHRRCWLSVPNRDRA